MNDTHSCDKRQQKLILVLDLRQHRQHISSLRDKRNHGKDSRIHSVRNHLCRKFLICRTDNATIHIRGFGIRKHRRAERKDKNFRMFLLLPIDLSHLPGQYPVSG